MGQVTGEVEKTRDLDADMSKYNFLQIFAISEGKMIKLFFSSSFKSPFGLVTEGKKISCIDNKNDKHFHPFYSAFLFIIFLITFKSYHIVVKFN